MWVEFCHYCPDLRPVAALAPASGLTITVLSLNAGVFPCDARLCVRGVVTPGYTYREQDRAKAREPHARVAGVAEWLLPETEHAISIRKLTYNLAVVVIL